MDVVADFRVPPAARPRAAGARPDRGPGDHHRDRQRHRHRRDLLAPGDRLRPPGDALLALSTSGNSRNVIAALREARRRGLVTIALVGYDGGRIAASRSPTTSSSPARSTSRASRRRRRAPTTCCASWSSGPSRSDAAGGDAWRSRRARVRVDGTVQGVGFRPFVYRLAGELGARAASCSTTSDGVLLEVEGAPARVERVPRAAARPRRRRWRASSASSPRSASRRGERGFAIVASPRGGRRRRARHARLARPATTASRAARSRATAATAIRSSTARTAGRASRSCAAFPTTGR